MRANGAANVALDALVHVHNRHGFGDTTLCIARLRERHATIGLDLTDLQLVASHGLDLVQDLCDVGRRGLHTGLGVDHIGIRLQSRPGFGIVVDGAQGLDGRLHGLDVLVDDRVALVLVGLLHRVLQQRQGLLRGEHPRQFEEDCRHDVVDELAHSRSLRHRTGIDGADLQLLLPDDLAEGRRENGRQLSIGPRAVQDQSASIRQRAQHQIREEAEDVFLLVDGQVVAASIDEVASLDGLRPKSQVRDGDAT
mmetsp:Transcript_14990/g.35385  ORF Transcript_14990/g.35385 Transcript_14990/m.35385 type:complete len:252 (-) Transcript_14990:1605-2360(-)